MATAPDPVPTQRMEELLTCCICKETLEEPITLPCFHSFCKKCLPRYIEIQRKEARKEHRAQHLFNCPTCRTQFKMREHESVERLRSNYFINDMLDILKIQQQAQKLPCESCKAQLPATCRCIECESYLCKNCLTTHKKWPAFKGHSVLSLEELAKPVNQAKAKGKSRCQKYGHEKKPHAFYCNTCQELACIHCLVSDHPKPDHVCQPIDVVAEQYKEVLKTTSAILQKKSNEACAPKRKIDLPRVAGAPQSPGGTNIGVVDDEKKDSFLNVVDDEKKDTFLNVVDDEKKDTFLEDTFLDSEYSIKEEVHEKFKRFSWLTGAYGVTGPNKKIPRPHIYVTVKRGKKKSEVLKEIEEKFKCDPKKYFELFREPQNEPKFKYFSKPKLGGDIVAVRKDNTPNELQISNDIEVEESANLQASSGTLTMFCSQNGKHYALTCFHVGCATDEQCFHQTFNQQELLDIHKSIDGYGDYAKEQQQYYYQEKATENADQNVNAVNPAKYNLGKFDDYSFHSESDIMSIQVREDIQIDCRVPEIDIPDWERIWNELYERVVRNERIGERVRVQKVGYSSNVKHTGSIVECNLAYIYQGELLFQNAVAVKGNSGTFLRDGDSGALVCFLDENNRKQAFAYGVCEVDTLHPEQMSSDEENDSDTGRESEISSEDSSEKDSIFSDDKGTSANIKATSSEGYGVAAKGCERKENEDGSDDDFIEFREEIEESGPFCICLKLNTALKNLQLLNAGCFNECSGVQ